jgi:aspartate racemase
MGVAASAHFEQLLLECVGQRNQSPPELIHIALHAHLADRTAFLLDETSESPAAEAAKIALDIQQIARSRFKRLLLCVPCNTFHAAPIWQPFTAMVRQQATMPLQLLSAVSLLEEFLSLDSRRRSIGLLCTDGSRKSQVFEQSVKDLDWICLTQASQEKLMSVIYSPEFGLKAVVPPSLVAETLLQECIDELYHRGANTLLIGCSELTLLQHRLSWHGIEHIDPMQLLAERAVELTEEWSVGAWLDKPLPPNY